MAQRSTGKTKSAKSQDWQQEQVLAVRHEYLFAHGAWQGIREVNFAKYLHIIHEKQEFLPRVEAEKNTHFKQIIPYLIFQHEDKYFLMQRAAKASEQRLRSKWSLGIGGHIRREDIEGVHIFDWARREFHEEISYKGNLEIEPIGILNDDSNAVGQVHIGFVLLLKGDSPKISIKSELQSGKLVTLKECGSYAGRLESWSRLVYDYICAQNADIVLPESEQSELER